MKSTYYQDDSDKELVEKTGRGDMAAYEVLYRRFETKIFHYLLSAIHDEPTAEDLLAEAMVAVWKGAKNFKGDSQVSTWIFGIARHKMLDGIRSRTRNRNETVAMDEAMEIVDPGENPEKKAEQDAEADIVKKAMGTLSTEHREVLFLAFYEELPYQEIAERIEAPINTVKTRVYYAKKQLKQALQQSDLTENPT